VNNVQTAKSILMIRPSAFGFNPETAATNDYQRITAVFSGQGSDVQARIEFEGLLQRLQEADVDVMVIGDSKTPRKPDAVYPNNWLCTIPGDKIFLFPMLEISRRVERRPDVVDQIKDDFVVKEVIDLSHFEDESKALEGTGSLVMDHVNRIAYGCISPRTNEHVFHEFCKIAGYKPVLFEAYHSSGSPVYHTNVLMSIGSELAVICPDAIIDDKERSRVLNMLNDSKREVLEIDENQQEHAFVCNLLQVQNSKDEAIFVMSERARNSLSSRQLETIEKHGTIVSSPLDTIEAIGGGSARCLLAELFLDRRN